MIGQTVAERERDSIVRSQRVEQRAHVERKRERERSEKNKYRTEQKRACTAKRTKKKKKMGYYSAQYIEHKLKNLVCALISIRDVLYTYTINCL